LFEIAPLPQEESTEKQDCGCSSLAKKELQQLWTQKCHDEKNQLQ
jgi:hypothetical protein